jgi:hypothetical protein
MQSLVSGIHYSYRQPVLATHLFALSQPCRFLNSYVSANSLQISWVAHCMGSPTKAISRRRSFKVPTGATSGSPIGSLGDPRGWTTGTVPACSKACPTKRRRCEISDRRPPISDEIHMPGMVGFLLHATLSENKIPVVDPRWCKMKGNWSIEGEREWQGQGLPIVASNLFSPPMVGRCRLPPWMLPLQPRYRQSVARRNVGTNVAQNDSPSRHLSAAG